MAMCFICANISGSLQARWGYRNGLVLGLSTDGSPKDIPDGVGRHQQLRASRSPPHCLFPKRKEQVQLNVDDHDTLGLKVVIQSFRTVLAADAAGLHTAERKLVIAVVKRVDPDVAGLELFYRLIGVNQIARPDRRAEAEFRSIGLLDGFVDGLEGVNG